MIATPLAALLLAGGEAPEVPPGYFACAGDDTSKFIALGEIGEALSDRTIGIIRLAGAGDRAALDLMVSPDAQFGHSSGDVIFTPRDPSRRPIESASAALIFYMGWLQPVSIEVLRLEPGPIAGDPCAPASVTVILRNGRDQTFRLTFDYERGYLKTISGDEVYVDRFDF